MRIALLALAFFTGCQSTARSAQLFRPSIAEPLDDGAVRIREDSESFVETAAVGDSDVTPLVRAPGRVAFREGATSEVGSPVDGRVTTVHVRVGQQVAAGDPLVTIVSASAAALRGELARARVVVAAAETELARSERMSAAGVGLESERVRAEAELAEGRALLAASLAGAAALGRGRAASVVVRAPIAGTVLVRRASVGLAVDTSGEALIVIGEPTSLWVVSEVFERELPLVRVGARARVSLASMGDALSARVDSIGGAVDAQTRRAPVFLAIDDVNLERLRAGMFARAEIDVGDAGLAVPSSAVLVEDGGRTLVFVARDRRTFVPRDVQIGAPVAGRVPILRGLARGERIVTRGALLLDGQADLLL